MNDRKISALPLATYIADEDLFVVARADQNYAVRGLLFDTSVGNPFVKTIVPSVDTVTIPEDHCLVVTAPYRVEGLLVVEGVLHTLE